MAPWLGLLQGRGLTGKAEPSSALCSASPVPRWLGVQVTHPGTPTSPRASPLSSASAAGPVCTRWPLCHPQPALSLSLSQVSWPCPEPEHCVHSKAWARDPPYAPAIGGGREYPSAHTQNCSAFLSHISHPHGPWWVPPSCCSRAGCGAPCGAQQMCPQPRALHEPAPARHGQEGDKAEGALAWLGVGNQLSASVLRLTLLSTSPCCCQSCTRAAHPSTPAPQHPADPSPVATPSPRHSRPGRQGMDAPVLAPAP